jgi:drug/metabolite transporter (DMT)-like permease
MPIDDPSAGLLDDEEAPVTDCRSALTWARGTGVVTLAFGGLVVTNVCVLLFKELSQVDGEYLYNPASALCMAEVGKMLVSCCVRVVTKRDYEQFLPKSVPVELSWAATGLALLYAVYNQLTFVVLTKASASTVALFKATTPTLVALFLWLLYGERINKLQWAACVLQMAGLVLVAEGAAKEGLLEGETEWWGAIELLLVLMAVLGALAAVWNSKALKGIDTPMPILNIFLYASGACFNFMIYGLRLAYSDQDSFFEGYASNRYACLVVVSMSLIGLSTSLLYKYGDAIISKYAAACSAAVLLVLEIVVWRLPTSSTNIIGAFIVVTAAAVYLDIAVNLPPQAWPFDFPGAYAVARCASSEDGRAKMLRARSSAEVLQVVEEAEHKLLWPSLSARYGVESGRVTFSRGAVDAVAVVSVACGAAALVCVLAGHRTLLGY